MPELPEVEVTRRSFAHAIEQARILSVRVGKPLRWPLGCAAEELIGQQVLHVGRRGKYLLLALQHGYLLLHLGMSGSVRFARDMTPPGPHDHFDLVTTHGTLRLHDPRRFGAVVHVTSLEDARAHKLLGHLGMEPLTDAFDLTAFQSGLRQRKAAIKQVLLAGDLLVGVGNIYASEALFMAGIRPERSAASLGRARVARLHAAIREVLGRAVAQGGSTLRDFSSADGVPGYFQLQAHVYARAQQPCHVCATPIRQIRQGQRSSFYCPKCQR